MACRFDSGQSYQLFGVWRSLVAHLVWDQGVQGSNPCTPTINAPLDKLVKSLLSKGRGLSVRIREGVPYAGIIQW